VREAESLARYLAIPPISGQRIVLEPSAPDEVAAIRAGNGDVELLIGPEGGLEPAELEAAADSGFRALRLGPRILRTETAGIAAIAILQALHGDLK